MPNIRISIVTLTNVHCKKMEDNIVNSVLDLYEKNNWKGIVEKYHDHPERNKLLWVFPSEDNLRFLKESLVKLNCDSVLSIGCGSGLLEWIINKATGFPVTGVEVDGAWWHCKYAPPTFIPLLLTSDELDRDVVTALENPSTALLFCYFNNRAAFQNYLRHYKGNVLIIIGPDKSGVHTDPKPFNDISGDWKLLKWQEVRHSRDFIAIYCK